MTKHQKIHLMKTFFQQILPFLLNYLWKVILQ